MDKGPVSFRTRTLRITNSSGLIREIKKHPVLYDSKLMNNNPELKKKSWETVAAAILGGERWQMYNQPEKEAIVREIQTKWKSLRDNFTRVLRKEKEDELAGVPGKRKKYIYFDELLFLAPYTTFRKSTPANLDGNEFGNGESDSKRNIIFVNESKDSTEDSQYLSTEENPLVTPIQTAQFIQFQPSQSHTNNEEEEDNGGNLNRKVADLLGHVIRMQKDEKYDDPMGNKKFLLSLLPFMKKLPDDVNLEVRLQLMSVLQTYSNGKSIL